MGSESSKGKLLFKIFHFHLRGNDAMFSPRSPHFWTTARRMLAVIFLLILIAGCEQIAPQSAGTKFQKSMAGSMSQAAEKFGILIIPEKISIAISRDIVVANAPIVAKNKPGPQRDLMFAYLSLGGRPCAALLPPGYYVIVKEDDPSTKFGRAQFLDAKGNTVMKHLPLRGEKLTMQGSKFETAMALGSEVSIGDSRKTMSLVVTLHISVHGEREWDWVYIDVDTGDPK